MKVRGKAARLQFGLDSVAIAVTLPGNGLHRRAHMPRVPPLEAWFVPSQSLGLPGLLGISLTPGGTTINGLYRDVEEDLLRLRDHYSTTALICLLEKSPARDEFAEARVGRLLEQAASLDIKTRWLSVPQDGVPPSLDELIELTEYVIGELRAGATVVLHGRRALGRCCMVVATCLTALGEQPQEAIRILRNLRRGALTVPRQQRCIAAFDTVWRRRLMRLSSPDDISDLWEAPKPTLPIGDSLGSRISQSGTAPLSHAGAATISYLGTTRTDEDSQRVKQPPFEGELFHILPSSSLSIGRQSNCDIVIGSRKISRVHCLLSYIPATSGGLVVTDLRSRTGTWCGSRQVAVATLRTGEEFTLARTFRFRFESIG